MINKHLRFVKRTSRRLARALFHAMLRHGPKLERQQLLLGRFVDIGTELFAMTAVCLRGERLLSSKEPSADRAELPGLIDYFCRTSRERIGQYFHAIHHNADSAGYRVAQKIVAGNLAELEAGIVGDE